MSVSLVAGTEAGRSDETVRRLRVELACAYRLLDHFGLTTLIYNHITARLPGEEPRFLINPYGLDYSEVTASSLVEIDLEGNVLTPGKGEFGASVNPAGFVIHSAIHAARHDAMCVVHTHTVAGSAVSAMQEGLLPLTLEAMIFTGRVAYHDFEGVTVDAGEGPRLVQDLGEAKAMILRNHGLLVVGASIAEAVIGIYNLERACAAQVAALAGGRALTIPDAAVAQRVAAQAQKFAGLTRAEREFAALQRLMDAKDPSYRD